MSGAPINPMPLASVVLPVYNAEHYLEQAVDSVLCQSFANFELLLLNDGSTDRSREILESFSRRDSRCHVYSWPNRGLVATLNAGLDLAVGEFIIRMDADDVCRPRRFEQQLAYLDSHPECVAVGSRALLIDAEGLPIFEMTDNCTHEDIDGAMLSGKVGIMHPSAAIRASAIKAIGGYREDYPCAEDIDLFLRLAEAGRLVNLPEVLLDYRQHVASIGYSKARMQYESAHNAIRQAQERRGVEPINVKPNRLEVSASLSSADIHRKWAWWALGAGNFRTARKHALKALINQPASLENWKLCACVVRGY